MSDYGTKCLNGRVWTDSSAAIGICKRQGLSKLRHLDTQMLWIQQRVRNNDSDLYYVLGDSKPADIFTKPNIPKAKMDSLLKSMGRTFVSGSSSWALALRTEGGKKLFSASSSPCGLVPGGLGGRRWADLDD